MGGKFSTKHGIEERKEVTEGGWGNDFCAEYTPLEISHFHLQQCSEYNFILQMPFSLNIFHKNKPFPSKLKNKEGNRFSFISLVIKSLFF